LIGPSPPKNNKKSRFEQSQNGYIVSSPPLGCLYKLQEYNLGPMIWDKVRSYWEHVEEHIGNFGDMLRTHWELHGNNKKSNTSTHS
jgi:hypothetical protein